MRSGVIILITLIASQLLYQFGIFVYKSSPGLVIVRRREDAGDAEFVALDFIGLVEEQGHRVEQHNVTTKDGYKLTLFRVLPNSDAVRKSGQNPVIFLQHGLAATSDLFVMIRSGQRLVYVLSDAGYDVWLGNVRGNTYCREHETLSTNDAAFWNFSLDEYGTKDLPVMIDYTLNYTNEKKISYVGHSLGTTMVLMLLAEKPEYVQKIDLVVHFAPIAYAVTQSSTRMIAAFLLQIARYGWGIGKVWKQSAIFTTIMTRACEPINIVNVCWLPFSLLMGYSPEQMPYEHIKTFFHYYPAGASTKCFYQYGQFAETGEFKKYDYGNVAMNMKHYGQFKPPEYNLSHVNVPTVIFRAPNDPLSSDEDIKTLISHLHPNTTVFYEVVPLKSFNHLDFATAIDAKVLVYDRLMQILKVFHKSIFDDSNNALLSKGES